MLFQSTLLPSRLFCVRMSQSRWPFCWRGTPKCSHLLWMWCDSAILRLFRKDIKNLSNAAHIWPLRRAARRTTTIHIKWTRAADSLQRSVFHAFLHDSLRRPGPDFPRWTPSRSQQMVPGIMHRATWGVTFSAMCLLPRSSRRCCGGSTETTRSLNYPHIYPPISES